MDTLQWHNSVHFTSFYAIYNFNHLYSSAPSNAYAYYAI